MFQKLDFYGADLSFKINNSQKIKSSVGGASSIFLSIIFSLLVFAFGQDFFNRTNPSVVKSEYNPDQSTLIDINNNNFQILFRIENDNSTTIDPEGTSFYFAANYYLKEAFNGEFKIKESNFIPLKNCNSTHLPKLSNDRINKLGYNNWNCLDLNENSKIKNIKLGGSYGEDFLGELRIFLFKCEEGTINMFNKKKCAEEKITKSYLKAKSWYSIMIQRSVFEPSNYTDPITEDLSYNFYILNEYLLKGYKVYLELSEVFSDIGWIFETKSYDSSIGISNITPDYSYRDKSNKDTNNVMSIININMKKERTHYKRIYQKIQNLAANIGGILKVFSIIAGTMVNIINSSRFEYNFSNELLNKKHIIYNLNANNKQNMLNIFLPKNNLNKKISYNNQTLKSKIANNLKNKDIEKLNDDNNKDKELNDNSTSTIKNFVISNNLDNEKNTYNNQITSTIINNKNSKNIKNEVFNVKKDNYINKEDNKNKHFDSNTLNSVDFSNKDIDIDKLNSCKIIINKFISFNQLLNNNDFNNLSKKSINITRNRNTTNSNISFSYFDYIYFIITHLKIINKKKYIEYLKTYDKYNGLIDYRNLIKTTSLSKLLIDNIYSETEINNMLSLL